MAKKDSSFNVAQDLFSAGGASQGVSQPDNKARYAEPPVTRTTEEKPSVSQVVPESSQKTDQSDSISSDPVSKTKSRETKSRRFSLLIQPSLMDDLQAISVLKKMSLNELIVTEMKKVAEQNADLVEKYKSIFQG